MHLNFFFFLLSQSVFFFFLNPFLICLFSFLFQKKKKKMKNNDNKNRKRIQDYSGSRNSFSIKNINLFNSVFFFFLVSDSLFCFWMKKISLGKQKVFKMEKQWQFDILISIFFLALKIDSIDMCVWVSECVTKHSKEKREEIMLKLEFCSLYLGIFFSITKLIIQNEF